MHIAECTKTYLASVIRCENQTLENQYCVYESQINSTSNASHQTRHGDAGVEVDATLSYSAAYGTDAASCHNCGGGPTWPRSGTSLRD